MRRAVLILVILLGWLCPPHALAGSARNRGQVPSKSITARAKRGRLQPNAFTKRKRAQPQRLQKLFRGAKRSKPRTTLPASKGTAEKRRPTNRDAKNRGAKRANRKLRNRARTKFRRRIKRKTSDLMRAKARRRPAKGFGAKLRAQLRPIARAYRSARGRLTKSMDALETWVPKPMRSSVRVMRALNPVTLARFSAELVRQDGRFLATYTAASWAISFLTTPALIAIGVDPSLAVGARFWTVPLDAAVFVGRIHRTQKRSNPNARLPDTLRKIKRDYSEFAEGVRNKHRGQIAHTGTALRPAY